MPASSTISPARIEQLRAAKAEVLRGFFGSPRNAILARLDSRAVTTDPQINVVGVGIGRKRVAGRLTATICVRVYVKHKLAKAAMSTQALVPTQINGVDTDVIETGAFRAFALSASAKKARSKLRPIQPGCSVGFVFPAPKDNFVMAGTLGAIVTRQGQTFLLSNNHVLADEGQLAIGTPIYQPGLLDGGKVATDRVATLAQFIPLMPAGNSVDVAITKADAPAQVSSKFVSGVSLKSTVPLTASVNLAVHKVGRTTGYTRGVIEDISADVKVGYDAGEFLFNNQIIIKGAGGAAFSDAGDSGSLIVDRASGRATGLLFAGSTSFTIANHIEAVLLALGVTLVK